MIELKNVCTCYGDKRVLDSLSATFEKGRLTAVIGANGCGKSTLLKTAAGIMPPKSGEIFIDGDDLRSITRREAATRISYLSQGRDTPELTVAELVLHGRFPHLSYPRVYTARDREIALRAIRAVGIEELADKPLSILSGGMRQSAYVAMALAADADHILLDEPTTYLDIGHQLALMRLLRSIADGGCAVAALMHDLPLALTYADAVWVMRNGALVMSGTPGEVCTSGVLHEVFGVDMIADNGSYYCRLGRD